MVLETSAIGAVIFGADEPRAFIDAAIRSVAIGIVAETAKDATAARSADPRFGRGRHPANLNLADRFPCIPTKARDEAVLYKSDDFSQTDIVPAWRP